MRKFCNGGCRASYHEDRAMGLIYGSYLILRTSLQPKMEFRERDPHDSEMVIVGWEDGCKVTRRCCYCGAELL